MVSCVWLMMCARSSCEGHVTRCFKDFLHCLFLCFVLCKFLVKIPETYVEKCATELFFAMFLRHLPSCGNPWKSPCKLRCYCSTEWRFHTRGFHLLVIHSLIWWVVQSHARTRVIRYSHAPTILTRHWHAPTILIWYLHTPTILIRYSQAFRIRGLKKVICCRSEVDDMLVVWNKWDAGGLK